MMYVKRGVASEVLHVVAMFLLAGAVGLVATHSEKVVHVARGVLR